MANKCVVIATFTPKQGQLDAVKNVLLPIIPEVHEEAGCELYALHEDTERHLVMVEVWETRDHWQAHTKLDTVTRIVEGTKDLIDGEIAVVEMYAVPAGTGKGLVAASGN